MKRQPTWPTYYGTPLPPVLNPFNLYHYWLLFTWLSFQPSHLLHYLYQADPVLYQATGTDTFKTLRIPAFYRLYLMLPILALLIDAPISFTIVGLIALFQGSLLNWFAWLSAIAVGLLIGILFGIVVGVVISLAFGVAVAIAFGFSFGFMVGFAGGLTVYINAGITLYNTFGLMVSFFTGLIFILLFGVAFSLAFGMDRGIPFGVVFGVAVGTAFGITVGNEQFFPMVIVFTGLIFILLLGGAFSLTFGMTRRSSFMIFLPLVVVTLLNSIICNKAVVPNLVISNLVISNLVISNLVIVFIVSLIGGPRIFLYIFEGSLTWIKSKSIRDPFQQLASHSLILNELIILPLPKTARSLYIALSVDFEKAIPFLALFGANPFQRWAVQHALFKFLMKQDNAIYLLYKIIKSPLLNQYLILPIQRSQFDSFSSTCLVLLGEMGQTFVSGKGPNNEPFQIEYILWQLTTRQFRGMASNYNQFRVMDNIPLSRFSLLLYELLRDEVEIDGMSIQELHDYLIERAELYEGVVDMMCGAEIVQSFRVITYGLGINSVTEAVLLDMENPPPIARDGQTRFSRFEGIEEGNEWLRPTVVETLAALGDIQWELVAYQNATNLGQKNLALNSAASLLKELADYVQAQVLPPEQSLLLRLISHWRDLVTVEQGQLKEQALQQLGPMARQQQASSRHATLWTRPSEPLSNPYIAGTPVYPPLLVGRQDIFNQIASIWQDKAVPDSIILYGHRRMGKTSILRNLRQTVRGLIIYVDLQGEASMVASTAELLLNLAYALRDGAKVAYPLPLTCHSTNEAKIHFDNVLKQIATRPIFLALDEFEMIDQAVSEGKISPDIYRFLRSLAQSPDLTLILGGSHQLAEMSHDYQQAFFKSYQEVTVSFLDRPTAWQLITNPSEDFPLNYEAAAVELIMAVTGGQPYLIQQVCRNALDYLNHQWFDLHQQRDIMILVSDVNAVLGEAILRDGFGYFDGVWRQSSDPLQHQLLRWLATQSTPCGWAEIEATLGFDDVGHLLTWAVRHDILLEVAPMQWAYRVPLMREWVLQQMKQG